MASATDALSDRALRALRTSESRYRRLFETARDGILLLNSDTAQIEDVNPYLIERLGYSHAEFLGKKLWEVGPFSDRPESKEMFAELQVTGYVRYESLPLRTKAGSEIQVEFVSNSYDCEGIKVIQCNIRDISERKQAEKARAYLAAIVASSSDAIISRSLDDKILSWNAAAERLFGWSAQEAVGQSIDLIVPPERFGLLMPIIERAARGEPVRPLESIHLRKDGARIPTEITFSPIGDGGGNIVAHSFTVRDMTEFKRNEDALRSNAARLRELSRRLQEVETTERNAISRELHDRIGQGLTALSLMVGTLGARLSRQARSAAQTQLNDIQALLRSVVSNVRDVMAELRPPALADYGLLAALRHLVAEYSKRTGIAVNLSGIDLNPRLPLVVETAIYRISEEALNNIAKHAHAKKVKISLNAVADRIVLDIADDGVGFDASNRPDGKAHWGMITMRERAEAMDVTFRLNSAPGAGTRIVLEAGRAAT